MGGHIPLARMCVQVVMTPDPTSRVFNSMQCLSNGLVVRPAEVCAAVEGDAAKVPGWCAMASNTWQSRGLVNFWTLDLQLDVV